MAVDKDGEWHRQMNRRMMVETIVAIIAGIVGVAASLANVWIN